MKLSDEALQAPMGVFFPSVFCLPDDHTPLMWGQEPLGPDCGDIFDEAHWSNEGGTGTQVRGGVGGSGKAEMQGVSGNGDVVTGREEGELPEATKRLRSVPAGKLLGLDQAVHLSIDCASEGRERGGGGGGGVHVGECSSWEAAGAGPGGAPQHRLC